jgi:hypothetical protein
MEMLAELEDVSQVSLRGSSPEAAENLPADGDDSSMPLQLLFQCQNASAPPLSETKHAKCMIARRDSLEERGVPPSTSCACFALSPSEPSIKYTQPECKRGVALL